MLSTEQFTEVNSSDWFRKAREASKRRQNRDLRVSLNSSLNESILSFEKIYKAEGKDIYAELAKEENHIFEERSSPVKVQPERRLSSFSSLQKKQKHAIFFTSAKKPKNDFSTNSSVHGDKKTSSFCVPTSNLSKLSSLIAKKESIKSTLKNLTSYKTTTLKDLHLQIPSSAQLKPKLFAYKDRSTKSSFTNAKLSKLVSPKATDAKLASLAGKYEDLNAKLNDIAKIVDTLTFETHFALPELIGESDKFRESMIGALQQMQGLVQARARVVGGLREHHSTTAKTATALN